MSRVVWIEEPRRPKSMHIIIHFGLKFHLLMSQFAIKKPASGPEINVVGMVIAIPSILRSFKGALAGDINGACPLVLFA